MNCKCKIDFKLSRELISICMMLKIKWKLSIAKWWCAIPCKRGKCNWHSKRESRRLTDKFKNNGKNSKKWRWMSMMIRFVKNYSMSMKRKWLIKKPSMTSFMHLKWSASNVCKKKCSKVSLLEDKLKKNLKEKGKENMREDSDK